MFAFKPLLKGLSGRDEIIHAVEHKHMLKCFLNEDCTGKHKERRKTVQLIHYSFFT